MVLQLPGHIQLNGETTTRQRIDQLGDQVGKRIRLKINIGIKDAEIIKLVVPECRIMVSSETFWQRVLQ